MTSLAFDIDKIVEEKFYRLKLDESKIKLVENLFDLRRFISDLNSQANQKDVEHIFVGVDTEWKPSVLLGMNSEEDNRVAVIQVATADVVYLIDMVQLADCLDDKHSKLFAESFLYNKKIIKLGYGFTHDIKMMLRSFVNVHNADLFRQTVLDLAYLAQQMVKLNLPLFDTNLASSSVKEKGLSELVRLCFGKPLNKAEQISNWERRPLRKSQIAYAGKN